MLRNIHWRAVQQRIWDCQACEGHARVETNVRQRTGRPRRATTLLFVGVAPPYQGRAALRTRAKSATNDPGDHLRQFIEKAAALPWESLMGTGAFLIHAVKCAIVPDAGGFQNPPNDVVDRCCPVGFNHELNLLRPVGIVAFGGAAKRAVLRHPSVTAPRGVGVSTTLRQLQESWPQGISCHLQGIEFVLHVVPFPRSAEAKRRAAAIVREAVGLAGLRKYRRRRGM